MKDYKIYYMMIGFLVIMIFIPPILRFVIPNENNKSNTNSNINTNTKTNTNTNNNNNNGTSNNTNTNTNTKIETSTLNCSLSNPEVNIVTTYTSGEITRIVFTTRYLSGEEESTNSLIKSIVQLKQLDSANYSNNSISFDFTSNDYSNEKLFEKFNRDINTQKTYYEQLNLSCSIINE